MKRLLIAATALTLLSGGAYAQITSNSGSTSTATNSSASQSSSVSNPNVSVIGNPIGNGASSSYSNAGASANTRSSSSSSAIGNRSSQRTVNNITVSTGGTGSGTGATDPSGSSGSSGGGDPTINYTGGYTVRNTPEVMPPSVVGGNTCAVGASAGLALPGFGIAGGATWADKACERRQQAALLYNMGEHTVASALMCQDDHVREAMREAGVPCPQDRPVAAAPAASAAAAPVAAAAPAAAVTPVRAAAAVTPSRPKPAWCTRQTVSPAHLNTLSEGQRLYIRMHCGV